MLIGPYIGRDVWFHSGGSSSPPMAAKIVFVTPMTPSPLPPGFPVNVVMWAPGGDMHPFINVPYFADGFPQMPTSGMFVQALPGSGA